MSSKAGRLDLVVVVVVVWGSFLVIVLRVVVSGGVTELELSIHTAKTHSAKNTNVVAVDAYEFEEEEDLLLIRDFPIGILSGVKKE